MNVKVRLAPVAILGMALFLCMQGTAYAFFPFGAYDEYQQLLLYKWSMASLNDANHDGDISGPNEGLELLLEGGPYGFTEDELEIVKESFQVWQDVPTSYIGFQFSGPTQDQLMPGLDLINYICMATPEEGFAGLLPPGVLGVTIPYFAEADMYYGGGVGFWVTRGQILEMDIVISAEMNRPPAPGVEPVTDLMGTMVHEIGHLIGLGHTPLNNVQIGLVNGLPNLVESPVLSLRDASGILRSVGATPTMFPLDFMIEDGEGNVENGGRDLAPDDIAAVSFMYPRGSQDMFFDITHEARTQTRPNLPSLPNPGAHVVAWCDADNDPTTPRVPLFSTITGLYEILDVNAGRFKMKNLFKNFEAIGYTGIFPATYTMTINELNGLSFERQAMPDYATSDFDSITGGIALTPAISPFPSEVFHESGNIFDISKADLGTPLTFDSDRNTVVSVDSGKTLPTMLTIDTPMFGDASQICWMNVVSTGALSSATPAALRAFRDNVLLKTSVGSAAVEIYYQTAPFIARFLERHPAVLHQVQTAARGMEWLAMHLMMVLIAVAAFVFGAVLFKRRRKLALFLLLIGLVGVSQPASAKVAYMSDEQMVSMSDQIVTGTVTAMNSQMERFNGYSGILSDITITVDDTVKGGANKSSNLYLKCIGGKANNLSCTVPELPQFKVGEEVVLYLKYRPSVGYVVVGGRRGKFEVAADSKTGVKYVTATAPEAQASLAEAAKSAKADDEGQRSMTLDAYKEYLRGIVKSQKSEK